MESLVDKWLRMIEADTQPSQMDKSMALSYLNQLLDEIASCAAALEEELAHE